MPLKDLEVFILFTKIDSDQIEAKIIKVELRWCSSGWVGRVD